MARQTNRRQRNIGQTGDTPLYDPLKMAASLLLGWLYEHRGTRAESRERNAKLKERFLAARRRRLP